MTKPSSKTSKFLSALSSGRTITRKQARAMFKLSNPSSAIHTFIERGHEVDREYTVKTTKKKATGKKVTTRTVRYNFV